MRVEVQAANQTVLENASRLLATIPGGLDKAVRSAMARATASLRTESSKEIRKRYAIKDEAIRASQNIKVSYSYGNGVQASVIFSGQKIPLYRYSGTTPTAPTSDKSKTIRVLVGGGWRTVNPGVAASAHQLASTAPTRFENAFVARMKSGHVGIFERTGGVSSGGTDAVREIMGSAVPQMLGNDDVARNVSEQAMKKFDERLDHEISRILNGYGG